MANAKTTVPPVVTGADTKKLERLLTQEDAAYYLRVSPRTIRSYVARGLLRAYRIKGSRLIRISSSELEDLVLPVPTVGSWTDV
jgi:excisionase family DNA binding protein